jgi:hypothetical protein
MSKNIKINQNLIVVGTVLLVVGFVSKQLGKKVGGYLGLYLIIPLALILLCGWIANKTVRSSAKPIVPTIALQAGHALWMGLSALIINQWGLVIGDIVIIAVGLVWLLNQLSINPVIMLTIYQIAVLMVNLNLFFSPEANDEAHRALLATIIIRILAVITMFTGLRDIKNQDIERNI